MPEYFRTGQVDPPPGASLHHGLLVAHFRRDADYVKAWELRVPEDFEQINEDLKQSWITRLSNQQGKSYILYSSREC